MNKTFHNHSLASGESGFLCKGMQSVLQPSFLFLLQNENNLDMIAEVAFYDETSSICAIRYAVSLILYFLSQQLRYHTEISAYK